jgi:hypothetical protein
MPDKKPTYKPSDLTGRDVAGHLKGTRLAAILTEIRDRFGNGDSKLRELATRALSGRLKANEHSDRDVYVAIRDRLADHAASPSYSDLDPLQRGEGYAKQADDIARSINWHRLSDSLQFDQYLRDHVTSMASDKLRQNGTVFRTARDLFLHGKADAKKVADFWASVENMARQQVGPNSALGLRSRPSREQLENSLERIARLEEYRESLAERGKRQLKETRPSANDKAPKGAVDTVDTMNWLPGSGPAYDWRKGKSGSAPAVRRNLDAEQYTRDEQAQKYALDVSEALGNLAMAPFAIASASADLAGRAGRALASAAKGLKGKSVSPKGPDGIAFSGAAGSGEDAAHPANLERQAVGINLHNLGLLDLNDRSKEEENGRKIGEYVDHLRNHFRSNLKAGGSGEPLTQHYLDQLKQSATEPRTAMSLAGSLAPLVKWAATRHFSESIDKKGGAWKSPSGGMVVRESPDAVTGTFFKGGSFTPDLAKTGGHDDDLPFGEEVEDALQPEDHASVDDEFLNDPQGWAAKRLPGTDDLLPVVAKANKSREMLQKTKEERERKQASAFGLLHSLQQQRVGENLWLSRLTDKSTGLGLRKDTALSIIRKFNKLTAEQKRKLEPLKFRAEVQEAVKGLHTENKLIGNLNDTLKKFRF